MKILHQMTNLLHKNNKADIDLCITTSLALLTLEKLSYDKKINKDTQDMSAHIDGEFIRDIMQHVANNKDYGKNISDAYKFFIEEYFVRVQDNISDMYLNEASILAREFIKAGLLSKQSVKDDLVLWLNSYANHRTGAYFMPREISDLLVGLVDIHKDDDVCVEWDFGAQLGIRASEITSKIVIENPLRSCMPLFIDILSESNISFEFCDPIINPSRVSDGKLHRYDITLSHPPFGIRSDVYKKAAEEDWFNRFPEKTNQGTILAIRHLLSTTKRIGIITVQDSILFSPGAGRNFREDLINQGVVSAVISMPSGLLPHTNIGFSILILTPSRVNDTVKFIDLRGGTSFAINVNSRVKALTNLNEVLSLVLENNESKYTKNIPNTEIESSGYNLSPGKYVLDSDMQSIHKFLKNEKTSTLGQHVEIIRPRVHRKGIDSGLDVLEIGAVDIPDRGYIDQPVKSTLVDEIKLHDSFAKHNDIVIIVKGSTGKVGIVPLEVPIPGGDGWILGQSAIILRIKSDEVDPDFLLVYLRSNIGKSLLNSITSGSTIQFIKLSDLKELPIIIPDKKTKEQMGKSLEKENEISQKIKTLHAEQIALTDGIWSI
jgi:type I restriction enzyme M protein